MTETMVTRGGQITLTKELRDELGISEGDKVVLNRLGSIILVSKKDPDIFDRFSDFLPERFDKTLAKIRSDERERLKRLGIVE